MSVPSSIWLDCRCSCEFVTYVYTYVRTYISGLRTSVDYVHLIHIEFTIDSLIRKSILLCSTYVRIYVRSPYSSLGYSMHEASVLCVMFLVTFIQTKFLFSYLVDSLLYKL